VRGVVVSSDRTYSYLGVRGFAAAGDYNTRILLLIDGNRVNDNVYDQASIGAEFGLDVATIERVEFIRGPASSLYGTNAVFGVVNVITRTGQALDGAALQLDAGTLDTQRAHASYGRRIANGVDFALSGSWERSGGAGELYFPAFDSPETSDGIAEDLDGEEQHGVYGRIGVKSLTITGAYGYRYKDVPTASYGSLFNAHDPTENTVDQHTFIDAQYDRGFGGTRVAIRGSFDYVSYDGIYPYEPDAPGEPLVVLSDHSVGSRLTVEGRATRTLPYRQTLIAGVEFLDNLRQDQWFSYRHSDQPSNYMDRSSKQGALFAQDEIAVRPWLLLTAGARFDAYKDFSRVTPRGAVVVVPSANQSFKYLYGKAFRAPNAYELDYYPLTNGYLEPETVDTHEIVWEQYVGESLRTSTSTYFYKASRLITLVAYDPSGSIDGLGFTNQGTVDARGLELEAEVRLKSGIRALGSYALQETTDRDLDASLPNSPRHMGKLHVSVPGPLAHSFASFEVQALSERTTIAGTTLPAQAIAHVTLNAPLSRSLELIGSVRNVFDARYADPASDEHRPDAIGQNGRTLGVGVRWTIGR
jgi:iron complex outermembrane receptor protein